jgi:hypothetical protein
MLYVAYKDIAYMFMVSGNEKAACDNFNRAYRYYQRKQARAGLIPLPRAEFVDYAVVGTEKVDANTGVAWKSGFTLNTNAVSKVKKLFAADQ